VHSSGLTVLAEQATPADDIDPFSIVQSIEDAEEDLANADNDAARDKARERLEQLNALKAVLEA
jgi:F-type H+-transporting ATPase subunit epsilon